jgi:transcription termination factor NusB
MNRNAHVDDTIRRWTLYVVMTADSARVPLLEAFHDVERALVEPATAPSPLERSAFYAVDRAEDHLPTPEAWEKLRPRVRAAVEHLAAHLARVDALIADASPRWRIDRMPIVDRSLLRMGVAEMLRDNPRPRSTFNGMLELAKALGTDTTQKFVNGILDEIRRKQGIAFQ